MPDGRRFRILVINPGSTSTKIAAYLDDCAEMSETLRHSGEEMAPYRGRPVLDQIAWRAGVIESALGRAGISEDSFDAVAGRGGLLPPLASGTYLVNDRMLEELRLARRGEHASNLGACLAQAIAARAGVAAYVVDPVSVDEWEPVARVSGCALIDRECLWHALNSKAVAKRYARERGVPYESLRLVVAHIGGGASISVHRGGLGVDVINPREEGPFSMDRAGGVPVLKLANLCFSGQHRLADIERMLFGEGGVYSHLGTKDLIEVERRIAQGDERARLVFEAMAYQIAKAIGAMATVLHGRIDAVLLTGGMAHSSRLVEAIRGSVAWIAPLAIYPGEDEMQALAEGVLRVLRGEEQARQF
ncbi:MAG TPA: butyrate kinase [Vicinamibacterales bacterium]|nr:butyrate kinase [Vicinamibacterales bacterium]HPW20390.1 butyrate kinase [Vicinamibacterales bacterium]